MADRTLDNRVGKILAKLNGDNISFWKNQWDTHVTYLEDRFDEFGYFSLALKLKKNVDIFGYIDDTGIKPLPKVLWFTPYPY